KLLRKGSIFRMNEGDDAFDLISLILVLALFTPVLVSYAVPLLRGEVGGFGVQIEKTARVTEGEVEPEPPRAVRSDDLLLMLVVADKQGAAPQTLDINGVFIQLDDQFFAQKAFGIESVRQLLTPGRELTFRLFGNA